MPRTIPNLESGTDFTDSIRISIDKRMYGKRIPRGEERTFKISGYEVSIKNMSYRHMYVKGDDLS